MKFLDTTLEALRAQLVELEEQREAHQNDVKHYSERAASAQKLLDGVNDAISDYARLLRFADNGGAL